MLTASSMFLATKLVITAAIAARIFLHAGFLYLVFFFPRSDTGLYSFNFLKRAAIILLLPFFLLYKAMRFAYYCQRCWQGEDWDGL